MCPRNLDNDGGGGRRGERGLKEPPSTDPSCLFLHVAWSVGFLPKVHSPLRVGDPIHPSAGVNPEPSQPTVASFPLVSDWLRSGHATEF